MKGVKGYAQDMREKGKLPLKSVPFLDSLTPLRYYIHAAMHGGDTLVFCTTWCT